MTTIEKAIRQVSDMRDFYRRIPKITARVPDSRQKPNQSVDVSNRADSRPDDI